MGQERTKTKQNVSFRAFRSRLWGTREVAPSFVGLSSQLTLSLPPSNCPYSHPTCPSCSAWKNHVRLTETLLSLPNSRSRNMSNATMDELLEATLRHLAEARPFLPMYAHLLLSALFPIYAGAHASLSRPSSAAKPARKQETRAEDDEDAEDDEEVVQQMEGLSPQDAIVFPVTAGIVLAGLYFLIQRYGADAINFVLGWYFAAVGVYSVGRLINDAATFILSFVFPTYFSRNRMLYKINDISRQTVSVDRKGTSSNQPAPWAFGPDFVSNSAWRLRSALKQKYTTKGYVSQVIDLKANLTPVNAFSALLGVASIVYANLADKPWWLTNLQGFAVCYSALQLMSPTTFATGSLILSGLFFYDIWAVFFTPLMVTVAKNIDQPIKLVFPRPDEPGLDPSTPPAKSYSMLGLGDIVLPGIMIGLALRFDLYMFYLKKQRGAKGSGSSEESSVVKAEYTRVTGGWGDWFWTLGLPEKMRPAKLNSSFPKPYFTASMIGYVVGMLATLAVMSVFHHAQPALLYLVPGVLISLWACGLVRGELKQMWEYTEAITGEQLDEDEEKKEEDGKQDDESWLQYVWRSLFGSDEEDASKKTEEAGKKKVGVETLENDPDKEGLIFLFSVAKWEPAGKGTAPKAPQGDSKSVEDDEDDGIIVATGIEEEKEAPVTRSRSTRRRKA